MRLRNPVIITSRLMPGLNIGGAVISLDQGGSSLRPGGRVAFHYFIDLPNGYSFEACDLRSGTIYTPEGELFQGALSALLGFLEAAAESYASQMRRGRPGENAGLFPPEVEEWAYQNSDEIGCVCMQLQAEPGLIQEDAA